jgi:uncharacterized protein involved in exopolysaccharide biosynthesis
MSGGDPDAHAEPPPIAEFLAHVHVRRRGARRIFGVIFALGLIAAAIYPAHYRATSAIAIMPSPEFTVREDAGSRDINTSALAFDQIMEGETAILESDDLHQATIAALGPPKQKLAGLVALYPDLDPAVPPGWMLTALRATVHFLLLPWRGADDGRDETMDRALRRFSDNLRVLPTKDSNVITVSFVHEDAALSARALNTMLARYADRRTHLYNDPQFSVAQHETDAMARTVQQADAALTAFKAARGFSDYGAERDLLLRRKSQAEQSLADARTLQAQSQARLGILDKQIVALPQTAPLYREDDTDERLQTIDDGLVDLRGRLVAAQQNYRDGSHLVTSLKSQIDAKMAERTRMMHDGPPSVVRVGRSPVLDPLLLNRAQAFADREAGRAQEASVQHEIEAIGVALHGLDADEARLADLTRRRAAAEESYASTSRAASEQSLTEAEDARRLANVRIIQPARVPPHQTLTRLLICMAGLVLGGIAACGWLMLDFAGRSTFLTAAGLEHASGFPVLAVFEKRALEPS